MKFCIFFELIKDEIILSRLELSFFYVLHNG